MERAGHTTRFLRRAGLVPWDRAALASCRIDPALSRILHVAALLEQDTEISARQARSLGIDRSPDVGEFLAVWEAEEAEHARALRFLLTHQCYDVPAPRPASIPRRRRWCARVPLRLIGRLPETGFVYAALGAAAEYVTIVTYTELARAVDAPVAVGLLRSIARQEGRHFAFFLAAARARGDALSPVQGRLARRALVALWEPVGVPSLGLPAWRELFAPLLGRDAFRARVQVMDRIVDTIPHLGGLQLMDGFLREHVPSADADEDRRYDRPPGEGPEGKGGAVGVEENKQVVEAFFDALARRDWDGMKALLTDDAHYTDVGSPGAGGTGPEGVMRRLRLGIEPLEGYEHLPGTNVVAEGDLVMTEHTERWTFHTGEVIDHSFVSVTQLRDGRICRWHDYSNLPNIIDNAPQWWLEHIMGGAADV